VNADADNIHRSRWIVLIGIHIMPGSFDKMISGPSSSLDLFRLVLERDMARYGAIYE